MTSAVHAVEIVEYDYTRIHRTDVPVQILKPATSINLEEFLWSEDPEIYRILIESNSVEEARKSLFLYLNKLEWELLENRNLHPLVESIAREAIRVFKNILSPKNEKLTGFSALMYLWRLAKYPEQAKFDVDEGFVYEFKHLFKAINGRPDIYPAKYAEGLEQVDFSKIHGRAAGIARSNYLDELARRVRKYIERYPSGLDPEVIEKRKKNREKILAVLGGTKDDWEDYKWHFRNVLKGRRAIRILQELVQGLSDDDIEALVKAVEYKVAFGITPYYLHLFDLENGWKHDYQVRRQVLPPMHYVREMIAHRDEREYYFDFMGEHDTSPHPLITRRYPMIAILKAANTCPQICVYCQRNWEIVTALDPDGIPSIRSIDKAIDWFAEHPEIREVLITGGDPLILTDDKIEHMLSRLSELDHVESIRIGTRIFVTVPFRITDELAEMLGSYVEPGKRLLSLVTHVESAYEVTPEMANAVYKVRRKGIMVYNQQVFTFWNSRRFETVALRIALKKAGIDPYYTFYTKGKWETKDYVVPVARILQERKEEARLLPGMYRTEEPVFNVPRLGKNHLRAWQDHELIMIRPDGRRVYLWHPWEKNIQLVDPYIYTDIVSIKMYLDKLQEVFGEDPEDYKSIWYYY
jgi:lysine 2,3-aminomutase